MNKQQHTDNEKNAHYRDSFFIEPHKYRKVRRIDMGPIVEAALAAVYERRWRRAAS